MRRTITLFLTIAMVLTAAGCSNEPAAPSAADTVFVQDMAMSASAAMAIADLARTRSEDPDIRELAEDVFTQVTPVVDRLAELGPQLAADGAEGFAHEDSDDHDAVSANRFDDLRVVPERKFDATFVDLLGQELRDGQAMAQAAQSEVTDPRSQALAAEATTLWADLIGLVEAEE